MEAELDIKIGKNAMEEDKVFDLGDICENTLIIYADTISKFKKRIKDKEKFFDDMKSFIESMEFFGDENEIEFYSDSIKYFTEIFDNILESVTQVRIDLNKNTKKFINSIPEFKNKRIVLNENIKIDDLDKITRIYEEFKDCDNVYLKTEYDIDYMTPKEYKEVIEEIKRRVDYIKSLELSPLENVMFTYDMVRERVYTFGDEENKPGESRDLKNVLFGKAIVCVGYARIISAILDSLNIKNELIHVKVKRGEEVSGHMRNGFYINDSKYKVRGYYYLDATWDSRKNENDKSYLLTYKNFLKKEYELDNKKEENYDEIDIMYDSMIDEIKEIFEGDDFVKFFTKMSEIRKLYKKEFNNNGKVFDSKRIMKNAVSFKTEFTLEEITAEINKLRDKVLTPIPGETYVRLLNNVRKIENYIDPAKYQYDRSVLFAAYLNSGWEFETISSEESFFLKLIFGDKNDKDAKIEINVPLFRKYLETNKDIERDIAGVKLAKALRKTLEQKQ